MLRVVPCDAPHITDIPGIHPQKIIICSIIRFPHLNRTMAATWNPHLLELSAGALMHAVSDFLCAGGGGCDRKLIGNAAFFNYVF